VLSKTLRSYFQSKDAKVNVLMKLQEKKIDFFAIENFWSVGQTVIFIQFSVKPIVPSLSQRKH